MLLVLQPYIDHKGVRIFIFSALLCLFFIYSGFIYTSGTIEANADARFSESAKQGKLLWHKNNCTSCHQLYGLGGYLGPDLTNIISDENKGAAFTKAMLLSGTQQMPKFDFTKEELNQLVDFLSMVDKSGRFPNKDLKINWYGSFEMNADL